MAGSDAERSRRGVFTPIYPRQDNRNPVREDKVGLLYRIEPRGKIHRVTVNSLWIEHTLRTIWAA